MTSTSPRATLFRRKPIDTIEDEAGGEGGLKRHLGLWQLTAIGIGGIIGAGIFTLAGTVAHGVAGRPSSSRSSSPGSRAPRPRCPTPSSRG